MNTLTILAFSFVILLQLSYTFGAEQCKPPSGCPKIKPMKNLDYQKYSGKWIEYQHTRLYTNSFDYECAIFDYQFKPKTSSKSPVYLTNSIARVRGVQNSTFVSTSKIYDETCTDPSANYMRFVYDLNVTDSNVFTLKTDYTSYTVEYACRVGITGDIEQVICVQGRMGKGPPKEEQVLQILKDNNINSKLLENSRPDNCKDFSS